MATRWRRRGHVGHRRSQPLGVLTDAAAAKSAARDEARVRRKALPLTERVAASVLIRAHIISGAVFHDADLVLTYVPVGSEVDVFGVAQAALDAGKRAGIPRTDGDVLSFDEVDADSLAELTPGAFGIPVTHLARPVLATRRTLLLVPLLAFDGSGNRLGSGKGFYDRFLAGFPGVAMGVAFAVQALEAVPTEAHDRPLDWVITEAG